jgi:uncharacterized membrane protein
MPNLQLVLPGLIGLTYLLLLGITITGLLKLVQPGSTSLRAIHRWATVPTVGLWVLVHLVALLLKTKMVPTFLLFVALVFGAALTGWLVKPGARRVTHIVLGTIVFLLFTAFIFLNLVTAA